MDQMIWGPSMWITLHFISMCYPVKPTRTDIKIHSNFIKSLSDILPCNICKKHFSDILKNININEVLSSKETYMKFFHDVHNNVNIDNGRKSLDYNEFLQLYQEIIDTKHFNPIIIYKKNKIYRYTIIGLTLIMSLLIIYIIKRK
jgi:hypothetical protein